MGWIRTETSGLINTDAVDRIGVEKAQEFVFVNAFMRGQTNAVPLLFTRDPGKAAKAMDMISGWLSNEAKTPGVLDVRRLG